VVRYAGHADALVDVHLPPLPPGHVAQAPVLVLLHGGFWRQAWCRRHTRPLASALRDLGWLVATPEYRRAGGAGGWPGTLDDMARLRDRLLPLLVDALPGRVAPGAPTLVGHSAGGHLALWWALDRSTSCRTVALAPVADLARAYAEHLGSGAVAALLGGGPPDVPDRYARADVAARMRTGEMPDDVVLVHGRHDDQVPVQHSRDLAADTGVRLIELDCEHFAPIDPLSPVWPAVRDAIGPPLRG
jgi:acetyl esterase/lipase